MCNVKRMSSLFQESFCLFHVIVFDRELITSGRWMCFTIKVNNSWTSIAAPSSAVCLYHCHVELLAAWHEMAQWLLSFIIYLKTSKESLACFHLLPQPNKTVISKKPSHVNDPQTDGCVLNTEPRVTGFGPQEPHLRGLLLIWFITQVNNFIGQGGRKGPIQQRHASFNGVNSLNPKWWHRS